MSGSYPASDIRVTEGGMGALKETTQQGAKVRLGKRSRGPESCII